MIITEILENNLIRTYSDKNVYIHGGFPEGNYTEAVDPIDKNRQYVETDIPIPTEEIEETATEILNIMLGRNEVI